MSQFSFVAGERIRMHNALYHVRRKLDDGKCQLEKDTNGEYLVVEETELRYLYSQNQVSFVSDYADIQFDDSVVENKIAKIFADYPEELQQVAIKRRKYILSISGAPGNYAIEELRSMAIKLGDDTPPHVTTVERWSRLYQKSGNNICSLIPNYRCRGNTTPRYSEQVEIIAFRVIRQTYLTLERISEYETLSAIRNAIEVENGRLPEHEKLPKPKRKFLRNIIAEMDAFEVKRLRYGDYAAQRSFREANKSGEIIMEALERVEIDHTKLDLIAVDEITNLPLGRPTITVAIDRCTRCICGYYVSYDPPNYVAVMKCLAHSILPKDYVKKMYPDIVNIWPVYGVTELLVVDNAFHFHGNNLEKAVYDLVGDVRFCPVKQPWWKGAVERLFRTMAKALIHRVPGTTFSNIAEKADYKPLKMAVMTESDINELLHNWIIDVYHQTVHRATLRTPNSLWLERITAVRQTLPASVELLNVKLSSTAERTLFHYGVSLNNLTYSSPDLQKLRRKYGEIKVNVRWDESDIGFVHILDENSNVYLKVPCSWFEYANGLSLNVHKAIREEALSHEGPESEAKLDAAKARVRAIVEKALGNKKMVTRTNAARAKQSFKNDAPAHPTAFPDRSGPAVVGEHLSPIFDQDEQDENIPNFEILDRI